MDITESVLTLVLGDTISAMCDGFTRWIFVTLVWRLEGT